MKRTLLVRPENSVVAKVFTGGVVIRSNKWVVIRSPGGFLSDLITTPL